MIEIANAENEASKNENDVNNNNNKIPSIPNFEIPESNRVNLKNVKKCYEQLGKCITEVKGLMTEALTSGGKIMETITGNIGIVMTKLMNAIQKIATAVARVVNAITDILSAFPILLTKFIGNGIEFAKLCGESTLKIINSPSDESKNSTESNFQNLLQSFPEHKISNKEALNDIEMLKSISQPSVATSGMISQSSGILSTIQENILKFSQLIQGAPESLISLAPKSEDSSPISAPIKLVELASKIISLLQQLMKVIFEMPSVLTTLITGITQCAAGTVNDAVSTGIKAITDKVDISSLKGKIPALGV